MTRSQKPRPRIPAATLVDMAGGNVALANMLKDRGKPVTSQAISVWRRVDRIPTRVCLDVHAITQVPLHLIRPDIYPAPAAAAA